MVFYQGVARRIRGSRHSLFIGTEQMTEMMEIPTNYFLTIVALYCIISFSVGFCTGYNAKKRRKNDKRTDGNVSEKQSSS